MILSEWMLRGCGMSRGMERVSASTGGAEGGGEGRGCWRVTDGMRRRQYVRRSVRDGLYFRCQRATEHNISKIYTRFALWLANTRRHIHTYACTTISNDPMTDYPLNVTKEHHGSLCLTVLTSCCRAGV